MNILLVNTHQKGGAANACIRLHKGLLAAGVNSKILFLHRGETVVPTSYYFKDLYKSKTDKILLRIRQKIHNTWIHNRLKGLPKGYEAFNLPQTVFDLTDHPLYHWADIVNLHWVANFVDITTFFRKCSKPIIWTLHDMWAFSGGYHYEIGFPMEAFDGLIAKNHRLIKESLKGVNLQIVTPSRWLKDKSETSFLFKSKVHHHIPYGLDHCQFRPFPKDFSRQVLGLPKEKKILLFIADSVHNKRKGLDLLLNSFQLLNDPTLALAIIGKNSESYERHSFVYPLGRIDNERFISLGYSAADLLVVPSLEDNFPNTVLEGLLCGIPVAGFETSGLPEMIIPGENGFLSPAIKGDILSETIKKCLQHPFNKKAIRESAICKYRPALQAERYVELFQQMISEVQRTKIVAK